MAIMTIIIALIPPLLLELINPKNKPITINKKNKNKLIKVKYSIILKIVFDPIKENIKPILTSIEIGLFFGSININATINGNNGANIEDIGNNNIKDTTKIYLSLIKRKKINKRKDNKLNIHANNGNNSANNINILI